MVSDDSALLLVLDEVIEESRKLRERLDLLHRQYALTQAAMQGGLGAVPARLFGPRPAGTTQKLPG